jgi:predicted phosphodiesterase
VTDDLLHELLAKPIGPTLPAQATNERDFTRRVEQHGNTATVTVRGDSEHVTEETAAATLRQYGLTPDRYTATGFRSTVWTMPNGKDGVSTRYTFTRTAPDDAGRVPLDDLLTGVAAYQPNPVRPDGDHGFLVLLGDMQFGKIDGDGAAGALRRTVDCLNRAADLLIEYRKRCDIGHVHIAWLGDHIEGFQSQSGANTWRTPLPLTDQIRLTRRVMLHAAELFAPLATRVSMAAVPGNHGEAVRIAGRGLTRYDDSHDTEALIAVHDAAQLNPAAFGHLEFFVPTTDELTVVADVAGTVIAHAHGHQWRPSKHFDWWRGQAFNKASAMHQADLLVAGHLHHELVDTDGPRTYIQAPAMEAESTWWRHATGTPGAPGLIVALTKQGTTNIKEVVR